MSMPNNPTTDTAEETTNNKNEYPSGKTVKFPFKPYKQQVELMDAILSSLKHHEEIIASSSTLASTTTTTTSKNTDNNDGDNNNMACTILLESPTGTGKSLSLACSSISWLKHMEEYDLKEKEAMPNNPSTNDNNNNNDNWIDDWISNKNNNKKEKNAQNYKNSCSVALKNRKKLENELNIIRNKISIAYDDDDNDNERRNNIRNNLVRSTITSAIMSDRKRRKKYLRRKKFNKTITTAAATTIGQQQKQKNEKEEDFCLIDYNSNDDDDIDNIDSDDDNNKELEDNDNNNYINLIKGGQLDGSLSDHPYKKTFNNPINNRNNTTNTVSTKTVGNVIPGTGIRKIIYAARTHSQLTQFLNELKNTYWGKTNDLKVVVLGGRKLLCCHSDVSKKKKNGMSEQRITEFCLDLQKSKSTTKKRKDSNNTKGGCPYHSSKNATAGLSLHILSQPTDIEDLSSIGASVNTCPYYASREAVSAAEIVLLPYNLLLTSSVRKSIGLSLHKSLVIIDEAHNLPEVLRSIAASSLTLPIIKQSLDSLSSYMNRYKNRLGNRNLLHIGQIRRCLNSFQKCLDHLDKEEGSASELLSPNDLLFKLKLDHINMFQLIRYLEYSRLPQKLLGFMNVIDTSSSSDDNNNVHETTNKDDTNNNISKHISPLSIVQTFMNCFTCNDEEGKVIIEMNKNDIPTLRYVLLNPAIPFENVRKEAHGIILAGGTLSPFSHIISELLGPDEVTTIIKSIDTNNNKNNVLQQHQQKSLLKRDGSITIFSCSHVIPSNHVITIPLSIGPTNNTTLDFRYNNRSNDNELANELGRIISNLINVIPGGLVIFLPSYKFEAELICKWQISSILSQINKKKKIYREPKNASDVENILDLYSKDALSKKGALLLCVVGGKMSEGINFKDDMARGVVVVGLPYPDCSDAELKEKMSILDKRKQGLGREYYRNLCMRAVNQSVGRAVRHANDYAAVILADVRYSTDKKVWQSLPGWLRGGELQPKQLSFGKALFQLSNFFKQHR